MTKSSHQHENETLDKGSRWRNDMCACFPRESNVHCATSWQGLEHSKLSRECLEIDNLLEETNHYLVTGNWDRIVQVLCVFLLCSASQMNPVNPVL